MTTAKILGRAWLYDDEPTALDLWEHEFVPMGRGRSGAEWCNEYLLQCLTSEDLRELLGVPAAGNFQVLFKGEMNGWKVELMAGDEYDEDFEVEESKFEAIPQSYMEAGR